MDAAKIQRIAAAAYKVPTDCPESDGTLEWDSTTLVTVHIDAGGKRGLGYSYTGSGAVAVVREQIEKALEGLDALDIPRCLSAMRARIRNLGESGIAAMAVAAAESALWDLKAKLLELPLVLLLGRARDRVAIYGSGGFTSYTDAELERQLGGWASQGIGRVKMKIGRDPGRDPERIRRAREAIGSRTALFVDANGGYGRKQAIAMAQVLGEYGVTWYEEPVSQHDREGLRFIRERMPASIEVAAGEYGFTVRDFRELLDARSVDVLQADATRCGMTDYLRAGTVCGAYGVPMSAHCAPALHLHPSCALEPVRHMEYFHDHVRIERLLLDGVPEPVDGFLSPDLGRPGHGLELKESDASRYAA